MASLGRSILWVGFLLGSHSLAQTYVPSLKEALKGKLFALRSYSADPIAMYDWQGGKLTAQEPVLHTLGIFKTRSVKQKGDTIRVEGDRFTLLGMDATGKFGRSAEDSMTLEVNLHGADPAAVLPALQGELFFESINAAIASVPLQFKHLIPWSPKLPSPAVPGSVWIERDGVWEQLSLGETRLQLPKATFIAQPAFSEQARQKRLSGNVGVAFVVNEAGHPTDLWMADPSAIDLDEAAVAAVKRYVFEPAKFEKKAVAVPLVVEVNFQIF